MLADKSVTDMEEGEVGVGAEDILINRLTEVAMEEDILDMEVVVGMEEVAQQK